MVSCGRDEFERDLSPRDFFDREFQIMLDSSSSIGCMMLSYIERSLAQFGLKNSFQAHEILIEAYVRGCKLIDSGEPINNPVAWTKKTTFNVIREHSRDRKRLVQAENQQIDKHINQPLEPVEDFSEDYKLIMQAFSRLTLEEQELLTLKVIKKLSWKQISEYLYQKDNKNILPENNLRKKKERILKRLHQIYHSLKSSTN